MRTVLSECKEMVLNLNICLCSRKYTLKYLLTLIGGITVFKVTTERRVFIAEDSMCAWYFTMTMLPFSLRCFVLHRRKLLGVYLLMFSVCSVSLYYCNYINDLNMSISYIEYLVSNDALVLEHLAASSMDSPNRRFNLTYQLNKTHRRPTERLTIKESRVKINGTDRELDWDDLVAIPDEQWKKNFDSRVYAMYPQAVNLASTIENLKKGHPIDEVSKNSYKPPCCLFLRFIWSENFIKIKNRGIYAGGILLASAI